MEIALEPSQAKPVAKLEIQLVDPLTFAEWNQLLLSHPQACFFQTAEWSRVLQSTYGHRPLFFAALDGQRLAALLAVMEVSSPVTGKRGVSLPFTDFCPALLSPGLKFESLLQEVLRYGEGRWKYLELRGPGCEQLQIQPSVSFWGHKLDLSGGEKVLFDGMESEMRTAIRKAQKAGLQIEISRSEASMRAFYQLHCGTRKRHGLPPQPYSFFRHISEHVLAKEMGFVATAKHGHQPIAASVFFHFGKEAIYKYGASDRASQRLRANNLVMWEAIQWYARNGYRCLDFGRSGLTEEGLCRFKRGFGAEQYKLDYFKYDFKKQAFVTDHDKAAGLHNHVFRWMPGSLARIAGALLYQHLS